MAKHVLNYRVFDGKLCKNTVKHVSEGFLVYMFELASGIGTWKIEENNLNSGIFKGLGR